MAAEKLTYTDGEATLEGELFAPEGASGPRPAVLVNHVWRGKTDFERDKCEMLRELGYVAVLLDNFAGQTGSNKEECQALVRPFMEDRQKLLARLTAGYEAAQAHPAVDAERVAAIGFCFGGLCVLDLARSGAPLAGVASFHGLLKPNGLAPRPIRAKVLVMHGYDDPMAPPEDMMALTRELTEAGCDWQLHAYGQTMHAFTNPSADAPADGLKYNPAAERRSLSTLRDFLGELFS